MNICLLTPEFPPHTNWGGTATFNYHLAHLLSSQGHKVVVLTLHPQRKSFHRHIVFHDTSSCLVIYCRPESQYSVLNICLKVIRTIMYRFVQNDLAFIFDWNVIAFFNYRNLLKHYPIDIIHTQESLASYFLIKVFHKNTPVIVHSHSPQILLNPYYKTTGANRIRAWIERKVAVGQSSLVVPCSLTIADYWEKYFPRVTRYYIQNFISGKQQKTAKTDAEHANHPNLIFIGRLEYRKGVDILLQAVMTLRKKYPSIKLHLIGLDNSSFLVNNKLTSFKEYSRLLYSRVQLQGVVFVGFFKTTEMVYQYIHRECPNPILIHPSRFEPFGYSIIECMARKISVIVADSSGPGEIVTHGVTGITLSPTPRAICRAVSCLINHPHQRQRMIRNAYDAFKNQYSSQAVWSHYEMIYKSLRKITARQNESPSTLNNNFEQMK